MVLPTSPAIIRVWRIWPSQASIIVGPGNWGGRHQDHPPTIFCHQWRLTHNSGGPRQRGGVQHTLADNTHQGEELNNQVYVSTQRYEVPKTQCIGEGPTYTLT